MPATPVLPRLGGCCPSFLPTAKSPPFSLRPFPSLNTLEPVLERLLHIHL